MSARRPRGFSLIELVVAINLFAILVAAIAAIESSVLRQQSKVMGNALVASGATSIGKAFGSMGSSASFIGAPAAGTAAPSATFWENFDWTTSTAIDPTQPVRFRHFCIQPTGASPNEGLLWFYEGGFPMPAIACGVGAANGVTRARIAGAGDVTVTALFFRPANENNLIQLSYTVTLPASNTREAFSMSNASQIEIRGPTL
jgi:prepilin-type N-terminal cleavage/methylation domain-containing protein